METNNNQTFFQKNQNLIKIAVIGLLSLLLLIPIAFVQEIVHERQSLRAKTKSDISELWGGDQTLITPILIVPYKETLLDDKNNRYVVEKTLFISSQSVKVENDVTAEKRQKGIFSSIVYTNKNKITGSFEIGKIPINKNVTYDFNSAILQLGLTEAATISSNVILKWNDTTKDVNPGSLYKNTIANGLHANVDVKSDQPIYKFEIQFEIRGSNFISFLFASKNADLHMKSNWPNPSFKGKNLPKSRQIAKDGFDANWQTNEFNNNTLHTWNDEGLNLSQSPPIVSVELIEPANDYQKNIRTSKYALFIIGLSFCTFFIFEFAQKKKIHPLQYLLVGFALAIFYLLLLSLSEHIGFNKSYFISAAAVIGIIVIYAKAIIPNVKATFLIGGILVLLYSYIFVLLQLEDYALLVGSLGLFLILATIMLASRKVDWYLQ